MTFTALSVFAGVCSIFSVGGWNMEREPSATQLCATGTCLLVFIVSGCIAGAMAAHG